MWGIVAGIRAIVGAVSADPTPQSSPQSAVQSGAVDASGYTLKGGQEATADGAAAGAEHDSRQAAAPAIVNKM